jgi:hypothetical protein
LIVAVFMQSRMLCEQKPLRKIHSVAIGQRIAAADVLATKENLSYCSTGYIHVR